MATHVWTTFSRTHNGKVLKFRIQELPKENYGDIFNLFLNYYATEEPVHKAANVAKNDETLEDYKNNYIDLILQDQNFQVDVCYLDDDSGEPKIVAGSIMYLDKSEKEWDENEMAAKLKTEEMKKFLKMASHMAACEVTFRKKHDLSLFYDDMGVVVHPNYRGLGVLGELFKARVETCKARKVPVTGAWMTTFQSQKKAAELGWTTAIELDYRDLASIGGVTFEGAPLSAKLMIIKV